jgi:hypothetical protein
MAPEEIPLGSITWYDGEMLHGSGKGRVLRPIWRYVPPSYFGKAHVKPRTLFAPPIGAVNTDARTARDTIQIIGKLGSRVPSKIHLDLGIMSIDVTDGKKIQFSETDIADATKVVDIDSVADIFPGSPAVSKGINRTSMINRKPNRIGKRQSVYNAVSAVRSVRL